MLRSWITLVFVFFCLVSQPLHAEEYVRIGSWNIQNLGDRDWGQHPKALAEHVHLAGVDVIALQEIHDTDGSETSLSNEKLGEAFALLNELEGQDWTYVLFPKRNVGDTTQHTGISWNRKKVNLSGEPFRIPVDYRNSDEIWNRQPYAVKFSTMEGKTDFVVIPVHMKSNFDGVESGRDQRRREAEALVEKLGTVKETFNDDDIVILGDTNCLDAQESALNLYSAAGFKDLNSTDMPTYKNRQSPFDRILVPRNQPEFKYSRQYILTPSDPDIHFGRLSDHFFIMTAFRILADDD